MKSPTFLRLPIWAGYHGDPGDEPTVDKLEPSAGEVSVMFHGDRVTARQRAAVRATEKRATPMKALLLDAIVRAYPTFREWNPRPRSVRASDLRKLVQLWEIIVSKDHHEDVAYVAYMFSCAWDPSGIVVVTHGDRVVLAGGLEVLEYPIRDPARSAPRPTVPTATQHRRLKAVAEQRAKKNPTTLRLDANNQVWIYLPVWAGFYAGPWSKPSKGKVGLVVGDDSTTKARVGPEQEAAYRHVVGQAAGAQRLVLDAIAAAFPRLRRGADPALGLPAKADRARLACLVDLMGVHVHWVHRDGVAYVGYQLSCAWDAEHGLGVLTHLDRVVKVGQADVSFLAWVAEGDRDKARKVHRPGARRKRR